MLLNLWRCIIEKYNLYSPKKCRIRDIFSKNMKCWKFVNSKIMFNINQSNKVLDQLIILLVNLYKLLVLDVKNLYQ